MTTNAEAALENYNIARDSRSCGERKPEIIYMDDGSEVEAPWKFEVCEVCSGHGKHVNPAIDAGGLSGEMMDDPDFMEGYGSGVYDVNCNACDGRRVVPVTDYDALTKEQRDALDAQRQADYECEAERLAEIRMGC